jgi:hypothetical protein
VRVLCQVPDEAPRGVRAETQAFGGDSRLRSGQMRTATRVLVLAAALAGLVVWAAGCGSTKTVTKTVTVTTVQAEQAPPARQTLFGHIKSLQAKGGGFVMRFDPEWFLSGSTANAAAAEDGAVEPGQPVPNDNYRVDEGTGCSPTRCRRTRTSP